MIIIIIIIFFCKVCYVNVHKRCQSNVANNCGINARQLADILNDMGMTPHQLSSRPKPNQPRPPTKVSTVLSSLDKYRNFRTRFNF